jgi:hypothetical protein
MSRPAHRSRALAIILRRLNQALIDADWLRDKFDVLPLVDAGLIDALVGAGAELAYALARLPRHELEAALARRRDNR